VKLKAVALLLVASLILLVGCGNKGAADSNAESGKENSNPITIKLTTVQLDNQQMGIAAARMKELVETRLAGKVSIQTYTGAQLYTGVEELEAIKKGDIQICLAIGSAMGSVDPSMDIFKLPFLFPDVNIAYKVLDGPTGEEIFKNLNAQGIKVLGGFSSGSVIVSDNKRLIKLPADLKGLKMRTSGKMEASIIESLGAISMVTPSEETYSALQQGVVDGMATPSTVFYPRRYHEVQKYVTNAGMLYWPIGFILANDSFWQQLPEDVRGELENIISVVVAEVREKDAVELEDTLKKIEQAGCEVYTLTPEEIEAWRQGALPVYDQYKDEIGAELVDTVTKDVAELTK